MHKHSNFSMKLHALLACAFIFARYPRMKFADYLWLEKQSLQ